MCQPAFRRGPAAAAPLTGPGFEAAVDGYLRTVRVGLDGAPDSAQKLRKGVETLAGKRKRSWKKILLWVIGILVIIFAVMQAIPYGRASHTDPPAVNPFQWTDFQAEAIAKVSCYDCHSNETKWWWATDIAPFSWLVQADVDGGRARLNFSEYAGEPSLEQFQRALQDAMPPSQYTIIHRNAKLNDTQKQRLIIGYADGMAASGGSSTGSSPSGGSQGSPGRQGTTSTITTTSADAAAVAVIKQSCDGCHSFDTALNFHAGSVGEAQALIDSMVRRGARLTTDQRQLLVQYFTR